MRIAIGLTTLILAITHPLCAAENLYSDGLKKWTTADSVAVRYYSMLQGDLRGSPNRPPVVPSPNGRYFYVTSFRGDLGCRCSIQTLDVYNTQQVRTWLASRGDGNVKTVTPLHSLERRTTGNTAPIREVKWREDSAAIVFIGNDAAGVGQIERMELPSGALHVLSNDPFRKNLPFLTNDLVLYRRQVPLPPVREPPAKMIVPVPRDDAGEISLMWPPPRTRMEWVASYKGSEVWVLPIPEMMSNEYGLENLQAWISPDSRVAVVTVETAEGQPQRLALVDFLRRDVRPLSDVSAAGRTVLRRAPTSVQVHWTADGKQAIVVNIARPTAQAVVGAVPVETAQVAAIGYPGDEGYIAVYDLELDLWQVLEAMNEPGTGGRQISSVGWFKKGAALLVTHKAEGKAVEGAMYLRTGGRWTANSVPASQELSPPRKGGFPAGFNVTVRQSANDPPVLVASEGGRERSLSSPDPALEGIWRARQEAFTWKLPDGSAVTGGLSLPRSLKKGAPVPLVIQACGRYRPDVFLPDGSVPAGFARQTLVAQGMAVLELPSHGMSSENTPRERPDFVVRLDAAVIELARQGLIDPDRVGLIGHSRTGHHAQYATTHPGQVRLAAVEIWDSWIATYPEYLLEAVLPTGTFPSDFTRLNGEPSFWKNKAEWLEKDVLFNVDRIEAPTLIIENGDLVKTPVGLGIPTLMLLGAYELTRRPLEFYSIPKGGHTYTQVDLRKPTMDLAVDWMRFWLQGHEDPSPEKAEQYARWRLIRQRNEDRKKEEQLLTHETRVHPVSSEVGREVPAPE